MMIHIKNKINYRILFILAFLLVGTCIKISGQVEEVIVETYYIADDNDGVATAGGTVLPGAITYRIFVNLDDSSRLLRVFGDKDNDICFYGSDMFYNHVDRPASFGFEVRDNALGENTLALDSWLTIGFASRSHLGILKALDTTESILGGTNNEDNMLNNDHADMGIPLTEADGLVDTDLSNSDFSFKGTKHPLTEEDTTIFGDTASFWKSSNAFVKHTTGLRGSTAENMVLIAQLTCFGTLDSFRINLDIETTDENGVKNVVRLVHSNPVLDPANEEVDQVKISPWTSYPFIKGCLDAYFVEYDEKAAIHDPTYCKDSIKLGCIDPTACNFDPEANFGVDELCCYNANECNNRDISVVCPGSGCMDPEAVNYNPNATSQHEGACCYNAGCSNPNYLEYDTAACHGDSLYCKILRVKGCMDSSACNYNPVANVNGPCDFNSCATDARRKSSSPGSVSKFNVYPNPCNDFLQFSLHLDNHASVSVKVFDTYSRLLISEGQGVIEKGNYSSHLDISNLDPGMYILMIDTGHEHYIKPVIKQ